MSKKACLIFSIWTSFFSALFYHIYGLLPGLAESTFGYADFIPCGWIMFVCLAIYFGMGLTPKDFPSAILSAGCGLIWGQVDFLLGAFFGRFMGASASMFISILVGTTITMFIHIYILGKTPFRQMPFIFAGVCLTFSQGGTNEPALITTIVFGLVLCVICTFMLGYATKKWPAESD